MTIPTPPATTLSTPSPTERPDPTATLPTDQPTMSTPTQRAIYLIVATTPSSSRLGIGLRNTLPWPQIKSDMTFFAKATRDSRPVLLTQQTGNPGVAQQAPGINAVIMGRKTYDSIPGKFRPLAGRLNVVISRRDPRDLAGKFEMDLRTQRQTQTPDAKPPLSFEIVDIAATSAVTDDGKGREGGVLSVLITEKQTPRESESQATVTPDTTRSSPRIAPILICPSLSAALSALIPPLPEPRPREEPSGALSVEATHSASPSNPAQPSPSPLQRNLHTGIGNIFVIGGAEIYKAVLERTSILKQTSADAGTLHQRQQDHIPLLRVRILQTQVRRLDGEEFECDTFFPVDLGSHNHHNQQQETGLDGWREVGAEEMTKEQWLYTSMIGKGVDGGSDELSVTPISLPQRNEEWARDEKVGVEVRVVGWEWKA